VDSAHRLYFTSDVQLGYRRPVEVEAPGIIARKSVGSPLLTGVSCVDAMVPIGLGQRELIIGDRQTGKTAVGLDMMINQAFLNERLRWQEDFGAGAAVSKLQPKKACYCIYVGVGQKQSTISRIAKILRKPRHLYERRFLDGTKEAPYFFQPLNYSVIVASISSDSAPLQYLAPYSGASMGEYFRDNGSNAVIICASRGGEARQEARRAQRAKGRGAGAHARGPHGAAAAALAGARCSRSGRRGNGSGRGSSCSSVGCRRRSRRTAVEGGTLIASSHLLVDARELFGHQLALPLLRPALPPPAL
jgi:hypothetical protein